MKCNMAGKNRAKDKAAKKARKAKAMRNPSFESKYGRKKKFLAREGGWGWEYTEPKPWK